MSSEQNSTSPSHSPLQQSAMMSLHEPMERVLASHSATTGAAGPCAARPFASAAGVQAGDDNRTTPSPSSSSSSTASQSSSADYRTSPLLHSRNPDGAAGSPHSGGGSAAAAFAASWSTVNAQSPQFSPSMLNVPPLPQSTAPLPVADGGRSANSSGSQSQSATPAANTPAGSPPKVETRVVQRNVYISGLPSYMQSSEFRELCQRFGRVEASKLCVEGPSNPTKGYGFVLYYTEESAALCIKELNGSLLNGRCLQARYAASTASPAIVEGVQPSALHPPLRKERRSRRGRGRRGAAAKRAAAAEASQSIEAGSSNNTSLTQYPNGFFIDASVPLAGARVRAPVSLGHGEAGCVALPGGAYYTSAPAGQAVYSVQPPPPQQQPHMLHAYQVASMPGAAGPQIVYAAPPPPPPPMMGSGGYATASGMPVMMTMAPPSALQYVTFAPVHNAYHHAS